MNEPKTTSECNYYQASISPQAAYAPLTGSHSADVCVVGGGIAGCSTALHLAIRGYRVVLLEAETIGWGASGRSGGQVIPGFAIEKPALTHLVGAANAKRMWEISVEGIQLLRDHIATHQIECDWQTGQIQAAIKPRHAHALQAWQRELASVYGYSNTEWLTKSEIQSLLGTVRYCAGLRDPNAGHMHPLKYTLGLAAAAAKNGASLFEHSAVTAIHPGNTVTVRTAAGQVAAKFVVLCGNAYLGNIAPRLKPRIMPVATYIIATEPLGEARARELIRDNSAVTDTHFILDYFRCSADHRLLFGGPISYSGRDWFDTKRVATERMRRVFPQLATVRVDYAWGGNLDITLNRAPDFGRLAANVFYLQGFSGHGLALTGMAGKLVAEAIAGQAERFDLFGRIPHRHFPGGSMLRTPALMLAMLWYRLRDLL